MAKTSPVTAFNWAIANMEHYTSDGVVFMIHYTVNAEDGTYSSSAYGSVGLEKPEPRSMIPYADLTKEIVIGWVKDYFGAEKVGEIEAALQQQLDQQHAPTTAPGLPWAALTVPARAPAAHTIDTSGAGQLLSLGRDAMLQFAKLNNIDVSGVPDLDDAALAGFIAASMNLG